MTTDFLKKFLSPSEIEAAIREAAELAERDEVKIALAGGVALQLYGSDRLTKDIDFLSEAPLEILEPKRISFGGVRGKTSKGTPIDFIVRDDDSKELYEEALEMAPMVGELGVRVVTVEYMATIKLDANRPKDVQDLETLIMLKAMDFGKTRDLMKRHLGTYAVKEFDSMVYEIEWRMSRSTEK